MAHVLILLLIFGLFYVLNRRPRRIAPAPARPVAQRLPSQRTRAAPPSFEDEDDDEAEAEEDDTLVDPPAPRHRPRHARSFYRTLYGPGLCSPR